MERTVGSKPHDIASLIICRSTTTTSLLLCRSQRLCLPWILDHWRIISAIEICNRRPDTLRLRRIDLRNSGRSRPSIYERVEALSVVGTGGLHSRPPARPKNASG